MNPAQVDAELRRRVEELVQSELRFPCPCCGHSVHSNPPGSYDICEICDWEDDALELEFATTLDGGANGLTLFQAQLNYADFGACERRSSNNVRLPQSSDRRDQDWRPIDPALDKFPDWNAPDPPRVPGVDLRLYYWRPDYWYAEQPAV